MILTGKNTERRKAFSELKNLHALVFMNKNDIRKIALNNRNMLDQDFVFSASNVIMKKILDTKKWNESSRIMTYMSFGNEVSTKVMVDDALEKGKEIIIPVIENGRIVPYLIDDINNSLQASDFGVMELKKELRTPSRRIDKNSIDIIIVPGVAFDIHKNRMGFGAGYYDRFLTGMDILIPKISPAFEIQIFDEIPVCIHDIRVDMIITEKRVIF